MRWQKRQRYVAKKSGTDGTTAKSVLANITRIQVAKLGTSGGIMTHAYTLQCVLCDNEIEDDGLILYCPIHHSSTLLVSHYASTNFDPDILRNDITRYRRWLPWHSHMD